MTVRLCSFFDNLVQRCARRGWWSLAEAISYHTKADHIAARIRWKSPTGNIYFLSPTSYIDRLLMSGMSHDAEVVEFLSALVRPSDVVWDVGANVGYISLETSAACPGARYYCFEPSPMTAQQLLCNAIASRRNLYLYAMALSDHDRCHQLFLKVTGNAGQTSLDPTPITSYDREITVATVRASTLIDQGLARPPTVLKLDTEGHEERVLEGLGNKIIAEHVRCVVFERISSRAASADAVLLRLRELGFELRELPGGRGNWAAVRPPAGNR